MLFPNWTAHAYFYVIKFHKPLIKEMLSMRPIGHAIDKLDTNTVIKEANL